MATYYCFACALVFDASINPPTEVKKNTFHCQKCAADSAPKPRSKEDAEQDEWVSIQEGLLGSTNKK
jgi:hypothetical protein